MPILDCVADLQVIYGLDTNDDDTDFDTPTGNAYITALTAYITAYQDQVKECTGLHTCA